MFTSAYELLSIEKRFLPQLLLAWVDAFGNSAGSKRRRSCSLPRCETAASLRRAQLQACRAGYLAPDRRSERCTRPSCRRCRTATATLFRNGSSTTML